MNRPFPSELPELLDEITSRMIEIRHDLHAHPELSFEEFRTTGVIKDRLNELGWELRPCATPTGAVARLIGGRPGRRVMLRADIDALPVDEESNLDYRSQHAGVMHACGHDVHTASLLGVADILARRREELPGKYTLVFQPAEERLGGASAMVAGGLFDDNPADVVLGAHVTSLAPVGLVALRPGIMMSRPTLFRVHLRGAGGHGAMASSTGNVVLAVSELASRLPGVTHDLVYEGTNCACSAGMLHAGTAENVVPRTADLAGTVRTFTDEQYDEVMSRLRTLIDDVATTFGVDAELEIIGTTPPVTNDPAVAALVRASAGAVVGEHSVLEIPPASPSDDVSEFLNEVPGCYLFVGGGLADGSSGMHHSGDFLIDDGACRVQAGVLAAAAYDLASDDGVVGE